MAKVKVRHDETLEQALRRFQREVQKEGILQEVKDREFYEKPSAIKRRKMKEQARRIYNERMHRT
ncbi:30S ribosomal protein S21 [candidate division WWE3 bacterium RIFCSPHIGHO2_01_FULL_40_23]|uniref:Small ribosomal subunit protein bS21 n=1 Tax=candidate division WWE3 bacterium RIFCSPLOWO2_01_FULL_41_18 TaxID=1802625 RepID=A0A1F4VE97_UNCKA|nr:MAG: 30S ribosomal protein S21 [candidate division WWE3 bacterium RIFCSPHIGHO2_01_FULL_40_23]OGC55494.1 MAG: 30S ribosomal protein S21 [candidate division WWE3 bacterium RIFCSPLOWO2_01_FULL_41_18]